MRKKVFGKQLSRATSTRRALFRSLLKALIVNGKIVTTKAKAKAIQGYIDKFLNRTRVKSLFSVRKAYSGLGNAKDELEILYSKVIPSLGNRKSGFTRIVNLPERKGDNAEIVRLEFVDSRKETKDTKELVDNKEKIKKVKKANKIPIKKSKIKKVK